MRKWAAVTTTGCTLSRPYLSHCLLYRHSPWSALGHTSWSLVQWLWRVVEEQHCQPEGGGGGNSVTQRHFLGGDWIPDGEQRPSPVPVCVCLERFQRTGRYQGSPESAHTPSHWPLCAALDAGHDPETWHLVPKASNITALQERDPNTFL